MEPQRKSRRQFSKQFKAETVALIRSSGKSVPQVCRDLDLAESVVRRWIAQVEIDVNQVCGADAVSLPLVVPAALAAAWLWAGATILKRPIAGFGERRRLTDPDR